MFTAISYVVILTAAIGFALVTFLGLRAVKLI